jgi:predicted PurR-regulated permease PerM
VQSTGFQTVTDSSASPKAVRSADTGIIDTVVRLAFLALLAYWSAILIEPFLILISWSVIVVILLYPLFRWAVTRLHLPQAAVALLITALCLLILLGPVMWLSVSLVASLRSFAQRLASGDITVPRPAETIKNWPLIGSETYEFWLLASTNLRSALEQLAPQFKPLGANLFALAGNVGMSVLKFVAGIVVAGFLFVPAPALARWTRLIFHRITAKRGDEFVDLVAATIRNLARGVLGIALVQSLLVGIGLIAAGVPAAGLISLLVLLLSILQVGCAIVLVPLVVWGFFAMSSVAAFLFLAYMIPVGLLDNFLRPVVMARGLKTPLPLILVGVLGGVLTHGLVGLFVGPVVLAIAWELLAAWARDGDQQTGPA